MVRVGLSAKAVAESSIIYSIDKDKIRSTRQIAHEVDVSSWKVRTTYSHEATPFLLDSR